MEKIKKIFSITFLFLIVGSLSLPAIVNGQEVMDEVNIQNSQFTEEEINELEEKENSSKPYRKEFEDENEAEIYYYKLQNHQIKQELEKKEHTGIHPVTDDVGNIYKTKDNSDIGNPETGGYGDFKDYYKNGNVYSFKFKGKTIVDTVQFSTLKNAKYKISAKTVLFCIEPDKTAEWISGNDEGASKYSSLNPPQKSKVNRYVSYATKLFSETGNFDYLAVGQLAVWEAVGATNFKIPSSLKSEWDKIHEEVNNHQKFPSFSLENNNPNSAPIHTLTYNPQNGRYETTLHDSNNVLDSRYLSDIKGIYGDYHVEDGSGANNLYVWVDKTHGDTGKSSVVTSKYDPMPSSGTKVGVHYTSTPTFANSGQDLVAGVSDPIEVKVQFDVKEAKGSIDLKKTEDDSGVVNGNTTNNPLGGAEFTLFKSDGTRVESKVTDGNGYLKFDNLSLGEYYVTETKAPTGYNLNTKKYNFEISEDGQIVHINNGEVTNEIIKGKALLTKVEDDSQAINGDNVNNSLKGAEFTIYDSNDKVIEIVYSDENGLVDTGYLGYGDYKIVETKAPEGYLLGDYSEEFTIDTNNQVVELNRGKPVKNYIIKGGITLNKVGENFDNNDSQLYDLSGAIFSVVDSAGTTVGTMTTDKNGYAEIENLEYGIYTVTETNAPEGYVNSGYSETVNIDQDGEIVQLNTGSEILNEVIKGKVHLHKVGETFDNNDDQLYDLPGAEFTIYHDLNSDGILDEDEMTEENIVEVLITDENGDITSKDLKWGSYIIKETNAPEGYINGGYEEPFKIDTDGQVIELLGGMDLVNDVIKGKVDLTKVGETNATSHQCRSLKPDCNDSKPLLSEAEFTISTDLNANGIVDDEDTQIETITTNQSGYALSSDLKYGTYTIVETKAPIGYLINDTIFKFEITKDGEIVHINNDNPVIDVAKKKPITVNKEDQYNVPIEGVTFNIYEVDKKSGDKLVDTITTDSNGEASSKDLMYGKYFMEEVEAPDEYIMSTDIIPFTIDETDSEQELTFNVTNELIDNKISIIKTDSEDSSLLKEAEFTIYKDVNKDGILDEEETAEENTIETLTTDENGYAESNNLILGSYLLKETKAPTGYVVSDEVTSFEITEKNKDEVIEYNFTNQQQIVTVELIKEDSKTKDFLSGAEFEIYKDINNNNNIDDKDILLNDEVLTNEDGNYTFEINYNDLFENKTESTLIFKETKAPEGYQISTENSILSLDSEKTKETGKVEIIIYNEQLIVETNIEQMPETNLGIFK